MARLDAGDPASARTEFAAARKKSPDPLLGAWEAKALAASGDREGAVALLADVLTARPDFAVARYNRAAWLVALGRPDEAAPELARALADKAADPLDVLEDPDFATVLDHPAFAFLPRALVTLTVDPVPPSAFYGTEVPVVLHVTGRLATPLSLAATARGPIEITGVREEETAEGRKATFLVAVTGAGRVEVGPFEVTAGTTARADLVSFEAQAPSDRVPAIATRDLVLPSSLLAQVPERGSAVHDRRLYVRARDSDRVEITPPARGAVPYEWRPVDGVAEVVRLWPAGTVAERVRIVAVNGEVVHDGPVAAVPP